MRRNNAGRRSNIHNTGVPGPLMTGHLKDIDLELELLKRKREMIEQQQQLLMEQQFNPVRPYDMRYDEPQHGFDRDYTHLYDNRPNQFGRKRQAEPQWQNDGSFKKNNPKKKANPINQRQSAWRRPPPNIQKRSGSGAGPGQGSKNSSVLVPMGAKPKQSIGQRIANQKFPTKPQKEFTPTKVSKPKASPAPNKLASQPLAERKALVGAAKESVSETDVSRMLLPDRVPTQQVSGRLELALGAIMKHVRELIGEDSPHSYILRSMQLQRVMKQAIRERIRTVMLGKIVGSLVEILAFYREEFPEETDMDIVNIALEAAGVPSPERQEILNPAEPAEDPEETFKNNMNTLLDSKLREMFEKLEEIYCNANEESTETPENETNKVKNDKEEHKNELNDQEMDTNVQNNDNKKNTLPGESTQYIQFLDTEIKVREVAKILPRFFKKYVPYLVKLINMDKSYRNAVTALTANKEKMRDSDQNDNQVGTPKNGPKDARYTLPYYVKIMGRPSLPKRKVMQAFLNQYNPKSIKKHRSIHNLLFVGFAEKSDFDTMVAADGTAVGRSTISVRICSNSTTGPLTENDANVSMKDEDQNTSQTSEPKSESDIISADLDGQITDLLSSIRKETDNDQGEKDETEVTDNNENDTIKVDDGNDNNAVNNAAASTEDPVKDEIMEPINDSGEKIEASNETGDNSEVTKKTENNSEPANTAEEKSKQNDSKIINSETNKADNSEGNETEVGNDVNTEKKSNCLNIEPENDKVGELKSNENASGRSTPSRTSARLANVTPSTIRTRRASRLMQN